jgi:pheromone a factor receptor
MSTGENTIYSTAIIFSVLSWLSWLLCIAPLIWHFSQRNVAAGSLVLWIILTNFSLGINPMIWPRDNVEEWWNGVVWCDINVRIQVGAQGGLGASMVMILRRLAKVMDTRNITVVPNRSSRIKGQLVELVWCWGYPLILVLLYIPVQSVRYNIWGIEGCISAYRPTWQSLVLSAMWAPITMTVAVYYAGNIPTLMSHINMLITIQYSSSSASTVTDRSSHDLSWPETLRNLASSAFFSSALS